MATKTAIKKKVTTVVTVTEEYKLSKDIKYIRTIVNGEIKSNALHYVGKNINGYGLAPIYKGNITMLKKWNPYWGEKKDEGLNKDYKWFETTELPEPDKINVLKDIIYAQSATHSFFDINLEPLPVVVMGEYIEARLNNANYDLPKLKAYFAKHKNVVYCSDIMEVPYYNRGGDCGSQYIEVLVYPKVEWLKQLYEDKKSRRDVFTSTWDKNHPDFLKTRKFMIEKKEDMEDED